ncbi:DUF1883 domain-containing protein [Rhizobium sp. ARZ01]|uniref:DUF1883 domain-containing protein n=1 Tax=Rhizobium sp. ARZ01 TaxID=2769313 RepID=UPI0017826185|nr:DUF1883 domain-containing protein [Rhizobium sp. ARZ01]MBD9371995.1 DUF1883 domain-containing protein [Rhizobium sp. ARZ01]
MAQISFPYTHYDLNDIRAGVVIEITLSAVANVRLMTSTDFDLFKNARQHKFLGGVAKKSPVRLTIPKSAHWHVIVDMEGHTGKAESSVRIVPQPKPPAGPRFAATS